MSVPVLTWGGGRGAQGEQLVENNTFASPGNTLHEHAAPFSWHFQV